jgi:uncharacterized membrane protein YfcA
MNDIVKYLYAIFIGSIVGFIGGFQGIAGGFYITMMLIALNIVKNQRTAAGTTLLAILWPISIGAVYEYWQSGDVDFIVSIIIAIFYTIFAWYGSIINEKVSEKYVILSLAVLMSITSIYFFHKYHQISIGKAK